MLDLVEPTTCVLSCQLRPVLILPLQIQGQRPFLFLSSLKIFQPKFSPLSHFPLTFHYSIKSKHEVGLKSFLCTWIWTEVGLKSFLCPLQRHLNTVLWSSPRCVYLYLPLHCQWPFELKWVLWYFSVRCVFLCPLQRPFEMKWVLVSVLKWVFLHGLIFNLSFFFIISVLLICTWVFLFIICVLLKWVFLSLLWYEIYVAHLFNWWTEIVICLIYFPAFGDSFIIDNK